jgi:CRP/FNR family transcriptional regulator, anaerobic regulatory protein
MTEFDQLFKALHIIEDELKEEILNVGVIQIVPKDSFVVEQHKYIK